MGAPVAPSLNSLSPNAQGGCGDAKDRSAAVRTPSSKPPQRKAQERLFLRLPPFLAASRTSPLDMPTRSAHAGIARVLASWLLCRLICAAVATSYISSFSDSGCTQLFAEWGTPPARPLLLVRLTDWSDRRAKWIPQWIVHQPALQSAGRARELHVHRPGRGMLWYRACASEHTTLLADFAQ